MRYLGAWLVILAVSAPLSEAAMAKADIQPTASDSTVSGTATFEDTTKGLKISITISGAPPGVHGIHIHEFGGCGDVGKAAGSHYNPDQVTHGSLMKDGLQHAHAGDFGNIEIGPDGTGALDYTIEHLTVAGGEYNVAGRAVILHDQPDDFSQPTGNAGSRIGCGPILLTDFN